MKIRPLITLSIAAIAMTGIVSGASAQGKTRAEVREELIQAENNGLRFVTDASYPDINPIFEAQVRELKANSEIGGSEPAVATGKVEGSKRKVDPTGCSGPVTFCTPYFGS